MVTGRARRTFGRRPELAIIHRAISDAARRPEILVLSGDAGVGKTHLLSELSDRARETAATVLRGSGIWVPGVVERPSPYGLFREAVRAAPHTDPWIPLHSWPERAPQGAEAAHLDPSLYIREQFLRRFAAAARAGPVMLVLDDVHWADVSSLALLAHLAQSLGDEPVLLAVATRPPPAGNAPEVGVLLHLRRQVNCTWLDVEPLADDAIDDLIAESGETDSRRAGRIRRRAAGNPLAAIELAHARDDTVPATVAAAVGLRMSGAPPSVRAVVSAAAVMGPDHLAHRTITTAAGLDDPGDTALEEAVQRRLLQVGPGGYRFGHPLEREAVYTALPPGQRERLHAAVARALEQADPVDHAAVAGHWAAAGDRVEVVRSSLRAATAASRFGAFPESLEHQLRALDAWGEDDPAGRVSATIVAADYARWAGLPERGRALLEQLAATPVPDPAIVWERVGWFRREIGDDREAESAYRRAIETLGDDTSIDTRGAVLAGLAALQMTHFELEAAEQTCTTALAVVGDSRSTAEVSLLITLGVVRALRGEPDLGVRLLERGRDLALDLGDEAGVWRYVGNAAFVLQNVGRLREAVDVALAARDRAHRAGVERSLAVLPVTTNAVAGLMRLGRWAEAMDLAEEALAGSPPPALRCRLHGYAAAICTWTGRPDQARRQVAAARELATGREPTLLARLDEAEAELELARGDLRSARDRVDAAAGPTLASDDHVARARVLALALRIEADLGGSSRDTAHRVDRFGRSLSDVQPSAGLALAVARAELARWHRSDDPGQWRQIADTLIHDAEPHPAAYALLRCAESQLRRRRRDTAARTIGEARALLEPLGPSRLAGELDAFAARTRLAEPGRRPADPDPAIPGLTRRESQVLRHLAEGASNRQIARALGITEKTASVHVSNLLAKLGVANRAGAAAIAHRRGLLDA